MRDYVDPEHATDEEYEAEEDRVREVEARLVAGVMAVYEKVLADESYEVRAELADNLCDHFNDLAIREGDTGRGVARPESGADHHSPQPTDPPARLRAEARYEAFLAMSETVDGAGSLGEMADRLEAAAKHLRVMAQDGVRLAFPVDDGVACVVTDDSVVAGKYGLGLPEHEDEGEFEDDEDDETDE